MENETAGNETAGKYLRRKREALGLTVDEVSGASKIRPGYIEAIENDDFSPFSSPHLLKGYVKLIVKTLGADDKEVLDLLEPDMKERFKDRRIEDIVGTSFKEERQKYEKLRKRVLYIAVIWLIAVILIYASVKAYEFVRAGNLTFPFNFSPVKAGGSLSNGFARQKSGNLNAGSKTEPSSSPHPTPSPSRYAVILTGKVIERTWVSVETEEGGQKTQMLYPGDTEVWKAKRKLKIKIGNGGGIILNYNGKNIGKPGGEKQVVTLNFPRNRH